MTVQGLLTQREATSIVLGAVESHSEGLTMPQLEQVFAEAHESKLHAVVLELLADGQLNARLLDGKVTYSTSAS